MRPAARSRALAALLTVCAVLEAGTAAARPEPTEEPSAEAIEEARAWFAEGRRLEDDGRWAEALALFQRVGQVKMTPQVRFHIALCLKKVGSLTKALDQFVQARAEAAGTAPDVVAEAEEHIAELEASIPTVTLSAPGAVDGDNLLVDAQPVPIHEPPVPIRVDPGPHTAEVRRDGKVVARQHFVVERGTARVVLEVPPDRDAGSVRAPPPPPPQPPPGTNGWEIAGWAALGVGAAALVTTAVFAGLRASALSDVEGLCPDLSRCDPAKRDEVDPLVSDGRSYSVGVNISIIVAGAGLATGAVIFLSGVGSAASVSGPGALPLGASFAGTF